MFPSQLLDLLFRIWIEQTIEACGVRDTMILSQLLDLPFRLWREQTIGACGVRYHDPQSAA
jgi:hypothetical protein